MRWHALLISALAMLPLAALLAVVLGAPPALTVPAIVSGAAAALVQALGLVRWPFAIPELARRYGAAEGPDDEATRRTIEVVRATLHRLLGVGIGGHLRYLLTGLWTLLVVVSIASTAVLPGWLGIIGLPIGVALFIGTLEFIGPPTSGMAVRGRHDRADRLHRLVALAHGARRVPAPLKEPVRRFVLVTSVEENSPTMDRSAATWATRA